MFFVFTLNRPLKGLESAADAAGSCPKVKSTFVSKRDPGVAKAEAFSLTFATAQS